MIKPHDPKSIPSFFKAGTLHNEGNKYSVQVYSHQFDTYPNNFVCYVVIIDNLTKVNHVRRGTGLYIGNFAPIFIKWRGQEIQVTQLLRVPKTSDTI